MCDVCVDFLSLLVTCRSQNHIYFLQRKTHTYDQSPTKKKNERRKTNKFFFVRLFGVSHTMQWRMCVKYENARRQQLYPQFFFLSFFFFCVLGMRFSHIEGCRHCRQRMCAIRIFSSLFRTQTLNQK